MLNPPVGDADHALGPASAPVTLVEFGDYECPHCARAHDVVAQLVGEFGDRLRYVFRNYPLVQLHPHALAAALVAEAAQGDRFWTLHDVLYANQDALDRDSLSAYALEAGVAPEQVEAALEGATESKIIDDVRSGDASDIEGTPTFYINGRRFDGDWRSGGLSEAIRAAL